MDLEGLVPVKIANVSARNTAYDNPHVKVSVIRVANIVQQVFLLLQAHLTRIGKYPNTDYVTDSNTILGSSIRILQAMIDVSASQGFLSTSIGLVECIAYIKQALWPDDPEFLSLPHISLQLIEKVPEMNVLSSLKGAIKLGTKKLEDLLAKNLSKRHTKDILDIVVRLPIISVRCELYVVNGDEEASFSSDNVVPSGADCIMQVEISRNSLKPWKKGGSDEIQSYCPRFPKTQSEGWIIILGDTASDELIFLKRMSISRSSTSCRLEFTAPEAEGEHNFTLNVLSDGYVGLNVAVQFKFWVVGNGSQISSPSNERKSSKI